MAKMASKGYSAQAMKSAKRVIMRIEVSPGVPARLGEAGNRFLSTNNSVVSRVIDCIVRQDDETQATILGLMPQGSGINATVRVLENIRDAKN
jgi:hypothetical protein